MQLALGITHLSPQLSLLFESAYHVSNLKQYSYRKLSFVTVNRVPVEMIRPHHLLEEPVHGASSQVEVAPYRPNELLLFTAAGASRAGQCLRHCMPVLMETTSDVISSSVAMLVDGVIGL